MTWKRIAAAVVVAGLVSGCAGDASGPGPGPGGPGPGELTGKITDASGDTFGNRGAQWDLTAMTITRDTAGITVLLDFSSDLISPTSGDSNAMIGFVDFDTDQDSTTGAATTVDEFRRDGGSTGMDLDFQLALTTYDADSSVGVFSASGGVTGHVKPVFAGRQVTIRIPRAMLDNDDDFLNAAAIVGTQGSPTDIIPETGHLRLGGAGPAVRNRPGVRAAGGGESRAMGAGGDLDGALNDWPHQPRGTSPNPAAP